MKAFYTVSVCLMGAGLILSPLAVWVGTPTAYNVTILLLVVGMVGLLATEGR